MVRYVFSLVVVIASLTGISSAQGYKTEPSSTVKFIWPEGKKMALSLTFDDARLSQPDKGIPVLDRYGVKGTFYISPSNALERLDAWKKAVSSGHEIGNHSYVHPCMKNFEFSRNKALEDYTLCSMQAELDSANEFIDKYFGVKALSFAYPCGQTYVGNGTDTKSYVPLIASMFETGRGWLGESQNDPIYCNMSQLTGIELDGKSFDQVLELIRTGIEKGMWLVLAGHEMNDSGSQTSLLTTIDKLCAYASDPANGIWIDNVHNIASYIKKQKEESIETSVLSACLQRLPLYRYIFLSGYPLL